jgi:hypothetical protein
MQFRTWFDEHYRSGDTESLALSRLAVETRCSLTTLRKALRGGVLRPSRAQRIEHASNGVVSSAELTGEGL